MVPSGRPRRCRNFTTRLAAGSQPGSALVDVIEPSLAQCFDRRNNIPDAKVFRVSKQSRAELIAAITAAVVVFQEATDQVDATAAAELGVNRTDLTCIGLLLR